MFIYKAVSVGGVARDSVITQDLVAIAVLATLGLKG